MSGVDIVTVEITISIVNGITIAFTVIVKSFFGEREILIKKEFREGRGFE